MSRFDFLKDKFQPLYDRCTQAEQASANDEQLWRIRQALEYIVREMGANSDNLFTNISNLTDKNVLDENMSRLFQQTCMITNHGIHKRRGDSVISNELKNAMKNLVKIFRWYAYEYVDESFHLENRKFDDVVVDKRHLDIDNINPLQIEDDFVDDDAPINPLEKDVFETELEYVERIAQIAPLRIGHATFDKNKSDGYTNIYFLQHHLEENERGRDVYFFVDQAVRDGVIDGELMARLRVYNNIVYCDYSRVCFRSNEKEFPVQTICWDKFEYENSVDYLERIEALPILPLALCKPVRSQYDIKQQLLPFVIKKFAYVRIPMQEMYDIPCERDLAKQVCAQNQVFTMFGKILPTGEVKDFIIWSRETGILYGTSHALEMKRQEEIVRQKKVEEYLGQAKNVLEKAEALKWYEQAAYEGNADAQCWMGDYYASINNSMEAIEWYRKASGQDNADAQYKLGNYYNFGMGVEEDWIEAIKWYRKAAKQGNVDAQYELGNCYYNGIGVDKDEKEAFKWYRKAVKRYRREAERGDADAQYKLGECFCYGTGIDENEQEAFAWYQKAVKQYQKAAEQGDADAQYKLGECYYNGEGIEEDWIEAAKWYRKAAEQGHAGANEAIKLLSR